MTIEEVCQKALDYEKSEYVTGMWDLGYCYVVHCRTAAQMDAKVIVAPPTFVDKKTWEIGSYQPRRRMEDKSKGIEWKPVSIPEKFRYKKTTE